MDASKSINTNSIGILAFLLLATLFLESETFVFFSPVGRFRPNLLVILFLAMASFFIIIHSLQYKTWRVNKAFLLLFIYFLVNIVALFFADFSDPLRFEMGLKVLFLLSCWLVVFYFIEYLCSNPLRAINFLKFFFLVGFFETLVGSFQMMGEFVRPTGTISTGDADFYAILISAYLSCLVILKILKVTVIGKRFDYFFIGLLVINLFFSFVRSAWIGFAAALLFLFFISFINPFDIKKQNNKMLTKVFFSFFLLGITVVSLYFLAPNLQEFALSRITIDSGDGGTRAIRLVMMEESFSNFLQSPIIGNGPSAFSLQGLLMEDIPWAGDTAFDPSIVTTILNDTGIIGAIVFLWFLLNIFSFVFRIYKKNSDNILMKYSFAFVLTLFGLFISYIPTTALWLPYSWVFFSLPTSLALASRKLDQ